MVEVGDSLSGVHESSMVTQTATPAAAAAEGNQQDTTARAAAAAGVGAGLKVAPEVAGSKRELLEEIYALEKPLQGSRFYFWQTPFVGMREFTPLTPMDCPAPAREVAL